MGFKVSVGKLESDEDLGRGGREVAGHSEGCSGVAGCLSEEVGKVNCFPKVKVKFRILKFLTQLLTKKKSVGKLQFIMKKIQVKVGERELVMMKVKESLGKLELVIRKIRVTVGLREGLLLFISTNKILGERGLPP